MLQLGLIGCGAIGKVHAECIAKIPQAPSSPMPTQLYDRLKKATFYDGQKTLVEERLEEEGFQLEDQEFVSALLEGREPLLSAADGPQATCIVLAAGKAIRTGEVQEL